MKYNHYMAFCQVLCKGRELAHHQIPFGAFVILGTGDQTQYPVCGGHRHGGLYIGAASDVRQICAVCTVAGKGDGNGILKISMR